MPFTFHFSLFTAGQEASSRRSTFPYPAPLVAPSSCLWIDTRRSLNTLERLHEDGCILS
jgi:hypothetical protein